MLFRQILSIACLIIISGTQLFSQTTVRSLFSRVYYFDQNGLSGETSVQQIETNPSNSRTWGMKNLFSYGDRIYLSYHSRVSDDDNDVYIRSSADGITWPDRVQANDDSLNALQLSAGMVAYGDLLQPNICVLWSDHRTGDDDVQLRAAVSSDGGNTFGPSVQISDHNDALDYQPDIAADDNGIIYVVWTRRNASNAYFTTWFSKSSDDGLNWTLPRQIHTGRIFSYPPQIIARNNGEVLIGICDDQNNVNNLVVYTSSDAGDNWGLGTQANNNTSSQGFRYFNLQKDGNGNAHFVHHFTSSGALIEARYQQSNDWGNSWTAAVSISDSTVSPLQPSTNIRNLPSIAVSDNGTIYCGWADTHLDVNNTNYETFLTRSTDNGVNWITPLQVNEMPELEEQSYINVTVRSGALIDTVVMVWTEVRDTATTAIHNEPVVLQDFLLQQNYPNPFNPSTTIKFYLPVPSQVSLEIFNVMGQRIVGTYRDAPIPAGTHEYVWNGTGDAGNAVSSGVYFYRLVIDGQIAATRKMILMQ